MSNERTRHIQALIYLGHFTERSLHPAALVQGPALEWALDEIERLYPDDFAAAQAAMRQRRNGDQ